MWKSIIFCSVAFVVLQHVFKLALYMSYFHTHVYNHRPGPCRIVPGIENGSEDIALFSNNLAFISSGLNAVHMGFDVCDEISNHEGNIFLFDFKHPEKDAVKLKITGKEFDIRTFSPHGISVYEDKKTGAVSLFVVNHRRDHEVIDVFQYDHKSLTLRHKKSIIDPLMRSVNDLAVVGPDSFYFTNDGYSTYTIRKLESLFMLEWASIGYYDGKAIRLVVDKGHGTNGIAASQDNRFIYVSEIGVKKVYVYERNADGSLKFVHDIDTGTAMDNIFVEPGSGDLWLGCHPVIHKVPEHFLNKSAISPSQVLHVKWEDPSRASHKYTMREVFVDEGDFLTASTIGVYHASTKGLLIGTTTTKLAYCQVNEY